MDYVIWGGAGFLFGTLVAYINYRLSVRFIQTATQTSDIMKITALRQVLNVLALLVVFLLRHALPGSFIAEIAGTALGLTLPSQLLALRLYRQQAAKQNEAKEGNHEGISSR